MSKLGGFINLLANRESSSAGDTIASQFGKSYVKDQIIKYYSCFLMSCYDQS